MSSDLNDIEKIAALAAERAAAKAARLAATELLDRYLKKLKQPVAPEWLTPTMAGIYIGVSAETLASWRKTDNPFTGPPYARLGNRDVRYKRSDLENWMQAQREKERGHHE